MIRAAFIALTWLALPAPVMADDVTIQPVEGINCGAFGAAVAAATANPGLGVIAAVLCGVGVLEAQDD